MSVVVQTKGYHQNITTPTSLTFNAPVTAGNIIVIFMYGDATATLSSLVMGPDQLGNTYTRAIVGNGDLMLAWYGYVTMAGTPIIPFTGTISAQMTGIVAEITGGSRKFIQAQAGIGTYTSTLPAPQALGADTGPLTPSGDAVIISCLGRDAVFSGGTNTVASKSGDTFVAFETNSAPSLALFEQSISGTGQALQIQLEGNSNGGVGIVNTMIGALCFSKPLARPGGTTAQYAISPGRGFGDGSWGPPSDGSSLLPGQALCSQRTVKVSLPYPVIAGSLVYFVVCQDILVEPTYTFTVSDAYGNTYLAITGASDGNQGTIKGFYCYANAAPVGECFTASFTVTGPFNAGSPYQSPGAFLVEHTDITSGTPAGTDRLSAAPAVGGTLITSKSLTVDTTSILTAIAFLQDTTLWTPQSGYISKAAWDVFEIPDPNAGNNNRLATIILQEKTAAAGTYNAAVIANQTGASGIILIAAEIPPASLSLACPLVNTGEAGVAFSAFLQASGGFPPYTFSASGLPSGLALNTTTGEISGTPTTDGAFPFTASVADSHDQTFGPITCEIVIARSSRVGAQTLRWQCASPGRPGRWFPHLYSDPVVTHYLVEPNENAPNDQELFMLAGGAILVSGGDTDAGAPITVTAEPGSIDLGDERAQKLYVDAMTEADQTGDISAQIRFNNSQQTGPTLILSPSGPREQFLENIASLADLSLYRNISVRYSWTGGPDGPRIYAFEPSGYMQPYLSTFMVTQFINLSFPAWKHHRRLYPALISNAPVIFTIKTQDGRSFITTIPSTGGQYMIIPLIVAHGCKQLAFAYQLDGQGTPFALFPESFTVETKSWDEATFIDLAVFKT